MKSIDDLYFLKGEGEMLKLTRQRDWSKTPVGPTEAWPQSLKTTLSIILNSKFPMFLFWGPELICFYNDAYRPSLGQFGKHPAILGMPGREAWKEIWEIICPLITQVLQEEEATWSEDQLIPIYRNGQLEDVYWTFSYSPVKDESNHVQGVLVTCTETTKKVNTLRGIEEHKLRFQNHIMQAPVAMCILKSENFVVEIANPMMLELWGKSEEEVLNRPIFEGLPEAGGQGLEMLLEGVYTTGIKFEARERPVQLPRNGKIETVYLNFIYEARTEPDGKITGIVAIANDVTDMVMARYKLERSEQRVRDLVQNTPFPMAVYVGKELRIELANQKMLETWGKGNDVFGKTYREILPELDTRIFEQADKVFETGIPFSSENARIDLMIEGRLQSFYFNYSFTPLLDEEGKVYGIMNTGADVTDLNRTKNQISESEQRFRNMAENSDILIAIGNELGNPTYFNQAWRKLTGRTIEELLISGWADLVHPEDKEGFLKIYLGAFGTQSKWSAEFRILNKEGEYNRLYAKGSPRYTADGVFEGYIGSCVDITEQKKAEEELKKSEQRFRNLIMLSPVGIALFKGPDHRIEMINEVMLKRWKKSERDILGKKLSEAFPEIIMDKFIVALDQVNQQKKPIRFFDSSVEVMESGELKTYYFDFEYTPLLDSNGDINSIISTTIEVTEKVLARKKIEESEERFRLVANSAPAMIWMTTIDSNCIFLNKAWLEFTGKPMQDQLGTGWSEGIHPEDFENSVRKCSDAFERREEFYMEYRLRRHDGEYRWISVTGKPRLASSHAFEGFIGACMDIHDQREFTNKLENLVQERTLELKEKNRELENMNKELQSFAYISSHDLQEPLRKIQTFSSRIMEKEQSNLSDNGRDNFRRMQSAARRMQTLIEDLLAYSRSSNAEHKYEITPLNKIVSEVLDDMREELQQKKAQVIVNVDCQLKMIPFQFRQLLNNLIGNSLKFSKPDMPPLITIKSNILASDKIDMPKLEKDLNYCHIRVSDNGIGFEPYYSDKIFGLFQRLHGKSQFAGTGIGLAIVKKIVDNHQGIITAKSELGEGARFDIYIPVE